MTFLSQTLSPRGWAFLVLAGGCVLAVPFLKVDMASKPRYVAGKHSPTTAQRLDSAQVKPMASSTVAASSVPSAKPILEQPVSQSTSRPPQISIDAAGIVELNSAIMPDAAQSVATTSIGSTAAKSQAVQIIQPARPSLEQSMSGAAPIQTELPAWARKSSLLDTLVTSTAINREPDSTSGLSGLEARKPSPFRDWTPQPSGDTSVLPPTISIDRYSPFRDQGESTVIEPQPARSTTSWPDEDPRTAVEKVDVERKVGRDAMIRDPKLLQTAPDQLGKVLVHPGSVGVSGVGFSPGGSSPKIGDARLPSPDPSNTIVQPKFGQPRGDAVGSQTPVGAALRSRIPPDEQLFIVQPKR